MRKQGHEPGLHKGHSERFKSQNRRYSVTLTTGDIMSTETQSKGPAQDGIASPRQMRAFVSSILRDTIEQEASGASR